MNPSALPVGTVIRLTGPERYAGYLLQRTADGWFEESYHCVDCAAGWRYEPDGLKPDRNATASISEAHPLDLDALLQTEEAWEVVLISAEWLRDELQGLLDSLDEHVTPDDVHDAISNLGIDAGLS